MIADRNRIYDGFASLEGGVDAGRQPQLIDPNQCSAAENFVFRGGRPKTRPGFRILDEGFINPRFGYYTNGNPIPEGIDVPLNSQAQTVYRKGVFQSAISFNPHQGEDCIMVLVGGRLFKIVPLVTTSRVTEIKLPQRNSMFRPIAYLVQADKWLIAQDGESQPIIYDGATARRAVKTSDPNMSEVPVGTIMAYGMGRIVVIVNERDVAFGDLYGSHDLPDPADSLPFFTERNFLAEGFDAAIPFQQGAATGMVFFPQLDTSTGNGQLLVFAERGATSFFLSLPREQWKTSQFQILALLTTGLRGHRSIATVNEDLWFRADDGVRSYRQARSEPSGWAHIPLSTNVKQFLDIEDGEFLKYASAIYFDNRIIITCSPHPNIINPFYRRGRPFHTGLLVVDFDILSSFGTRFKPAWDGHWTIGAVKKSNLPRVRVVQLVSGTFNGVRRAFAFCLDEDDNNQLYELTKDEKSDWNGCIEWELETRAFDFKQQGTQFEEQKLYDADIWLREIVECTTQPRTVQTAPPEPPPPPPPPPPTPTGACCIAGVCSIKTQADCIALGGDWQGADSVCDPNPCPPPPPLGACCRGSNCTQETQASCEATGGTWAADTPCDPNPCPLPPCGACGFAAFDDSGRKFKTRTITNQLVFNAAPGSFGAIHTTYTSQQISTYNELCELVVGNCTGIFHCDIRNPFENCTVDGHFAGAAFPHCNGIVDICTCAHTDYCVECGENVSFWQTGPWGPPFGSCAPEVIVSASKKTQICTWINGESVATQTTTTELSDECEP